LSQNETLISYYIVYTYTIWYRLIGTIAPQIENKGLVRLHLDLETSATIDLKKVGTDVYANHIDTRVLMLAYAFDDGPVSLWEPELAEMPAEVRSALLDSSVTKIAWNAAFEMNIISAVLHVPIRIEEWFDPMAYARYLGYPGGLGECGEALATDETCTQDTMFGEGQIVFVESGKDPIGKKLIKLFCSPTKATKK
jgi:DNA polymerase bacteriophage-type